MTPAHPSLWQPCNALSVAGWLALAVAGLAPQAVGASDAHAVPPKKAALEATKVAINAPDPLDKLRERLAERLAAVKVSDKPGALDLHVAPGAVGPAEAAAPAPSSRADTRREHKASSKSKATAHAKTGSHDAPHWAYSGEVGPQAWGGMKAEFSLCSSGQRQSPIDIREGMAVDLEPIRFNYQPGGFAVIDNGHTVQVNLQPGNSIDVGGKRFDLLQFHFHRPSEERIDGRQFDMVAHLVHKSSEGKLAVVAVLLDKGSVQPLVQTIWNNLPLEKMLEVKARVNIDINQMLPTDKRYYTYMGSLTTPPCSEGVQWLVLRSPVAMSVEQIEIFSRMYPMNARPVQSASGRRIMQSN